MAGEIPPEIMAQRFPKGFTLRDEANAIVALIFQKGVCKEFESDLLPAIRGDVKPRRVADKKMRKLMLEATHCIRTLLETRESAPERFRCLLMGLSLLGYRDHWLRNEPDDA